MVSILKATSYLLLLSICFIYTSRIQAQQLYIISNEDSKAVEKASVILKSIDNTTQFHLLSDNNGIISLDNIPIPELPFLIQINHIGFLPISDTVKVSKFPSQKTYKLTPRVSALQEIVITAQYTPGTIEKSIHKISVIDEKKIKAMAAVNLKDVLNNELNIRISQDNILGSRMSMQGIGGENVKIMIDGVPVIGRQNGNVDLNQINLNGIQRIELIDGPMSVNYGTNALAGTINLITKKYSADKLNVSLSSYNENIGTYNLNAGLTANIYKGSLNLSGGRNFFDGWSKGDNFWPEFKSKPADSSRFKSWKPKTQYFARGQYNIQIANINLGYKAEFFNEKITNRGIPRAPYNETAFDDLYHTKRIDNAVYANGNIAKGININFVASANNYRRIKNSYIKDLTTLNSELTSAPEDQDTSVFHQYMSRGSIAFVKDSSWINYELGYDLNYEDAIGVRIKDGKENIGDYAVFVTSEITAFKGLILKPGLRFSYNTKYEAPPIPSLNLKYQFNKTVLRASYDYGFRSPSIKELYFYFVDINHNIKGNTNLKAERSDNYSVSITQNNSWNNYRFITEVAGFYNNINDLITLAQTTGSEYSYINVGQFKSHGFNLTESVLINSFKAGVGFSYTGRYNELSEELDINQYNYSPEVKCNIEYRFVNQGLTASIFYKYTGKLPGYITDAENNLSLQFIDDYHMADFILSKSFKNNHIVLSSGIKNIFDVTDINSQITEGAHSTNGQSSPVATGRLVFLKLDINF